VTWLWLTLGAQLLFSVGVHVDKHLLARWFRGAAPGSLILFSALFAFVALPVLALASRGAPWIEPRDAAVLLAGGFLNITGVVLSLYAVQRDEASVVATLFQMMPVFTYGLAYLVLGETLTGLQVVAGLLVMAGAVVASLDLGRGRPAIRGDVLLRMALACLLLATNAVLFKSVAVEEDFWVSTFWSYVSLAIAGVVLFAAVAPYRRQFLRTLRENRLPVIGLNAANEVLAVVGYVMITYATLLVPVAMVSLVGAFQPLMVFGLGVLLTFVAPRFAHEDLSRRRVVQKLVAMAIVAAGTVLLHRG
jgi:drug/metabolite transporter (DMT)-like permease